MFLDRDGTINHNVPYCSRPEDFILIKGACSAIKRLNENNYLVIVITNQSGIARKIFGHLDVKKLHDFLDKFLLNKKPSNKPETTTELQIKK